MDTSSAKNITRNPDAASLRLLMAAHTVLRSVASPEAARLEAEAELHQGDPLPLLWMGLVKEGGGDLSAAVRLFLEAAAAGGGWQALFCLAQIQSRLGRTQKAAQLYEEASALKPELEPLVQAWKHDSYRPKRVLLAGEFFWPSLGGIEVFFGELAGWLQEAGYEVHVATKPFEGRTTFLHNGVYIHEFPLMDPTNKNQWGEDYARLLLKGGFEAVIVLAHLDPWVLFTCTLPRPRPRIIYLSIVKNEHVDAYLNDHSLVERVRLSSEADVVCTISQSGCEAQMYELAKVRSLFLPHAVPVCDSPVDFRNFLGISAQTPLLVQVANFWGVKNHLGLLNVLRETSGNWKLAIIGSPHDARLYEYVCEVAKADPRVTVLGRQPREVTLAAIRDADLFLMPSMGEGCPVSILEAMSCGTPWIATPMCGSVVDQAGGMVLNVPAFPAIISVLLDNPHERKALGALGRKHWRATFSKDVVCPAFLRLLSGKSGIADLGMPDALRKQNRLVQERIFQLARLSRRA